LQRLTGATIEGLWLVAVVTVSFRFSAPDQILSALQAPKVALLRIIVGALAAVLLSRWALTSKRQRTGWRIIPGSIVGSPNRLVVAAALCFFGVNLIAAGLSPSWQLSLWGKWPLSDGYSIYSLAVYIVLFLAIATNLKTRRQLLRLASTISAMGTAVGFIAILQHLGVDIAGGADPTRVPATFGNPLFAGQFFVLTISMSVGLALTTVHRSKFGWPFIILAMAIGLQAAGLYFTGSRGPWIGLAVALACFIAMSLVYMGRQRARMLGLLVLLSAVVGSGLVLLPATTPRDQPSPLDRVTEAKAQGLEERLAVWTATAEATLQPLWFEFVEDSASYARPLVGYGPELFSYVAYLSTPASVYNENGSPFQYAHNHFVHVFVELGFLGLGAYTGLLVASIWMCFAHLRHQGSNSPTPQRSWFAIAIMSGVVGWTIASLTGIPRIGDLTIFWMLLGILVALSSVFRRNGSMSVPIPRSQVSGSRAARRHPTHGRWEPDLRRLAVGLALAFVVFSFTLSYNLGHLRASMMASEGVKLIRDGRPHSALDRLDSALKLAPEFPLYYLERGQAFESLAARTDVPEDKLALLQRSYEEDMKGLELNRYSPTAVETTALTLVRMVNAGAIDRQDEAISLLRQLTTMNPYNFRTYEQLGHIYWVFGAPEPALVALDTAITISNGSSEAGRIYLLRGLALQDLGRTQESINAMEWALNLGLTDPNDLSEALFFLAGLYEETGDVARMNRYLDEYHDLEVEK
jgi:tetratricopeptide (TPR) repeat protein/O-antigen ligase